MISKMSSIPSNEINDLFVNVDKEHFASAIVGSEVDDGENAALRIVRSFSTCPSSYKLGHSTA